MTDNTQRTLIGTGIAVLVVLALIAAGNATTGTPLRTAPMLTATAVSDQLLADTAMREATAQAAPPADTAMPAGSPAPSPDPAMVPLATDIGNASFDIVPNENDPRSAAHLAAGTRYKFNQAWQGARCQVTVEGGGIVWLDCASIGQPDATPVPTPIPVPTQRPLICRDETINAGSLGVFTGQGCAYTAEEAAALAQADAKAKFAASQPPAPTLAPLGFYEQQTVETAARWARPTCMEPGYGPCTPTPATP